MIGRIKSLSVSQALLHVIASRGLKQLYPTEAFLFSKSMSIFV